MTYQREASEDMVQNVFYKMLKYRQTFTGQGEFVAWMFQIACNTLKGQAKKNKNNIQYLPAEEMEDRLPGGVSIDEQFEKKQQKAGLHKAMASLR